MGTTGASPVRSNTFDFLRLAAALAVLIHHSVIHLDASFLWHTPDAGPWFHGGVSLFFVLSGLMIYRSAERCHGSGRPWRDFYRNRALRIVPALYVYWVLLVVLLLSIGALGFKEMASPGFLAFAASNLFLIPVYNPTLLDDFGVGVINGSLWTIPVEVSFYLVVPLIVLLSERIGWKGLISILFGVSLVGVALHALAGGAEAEPTLWKLFGVTILPYLWYFAIGIFWSHAWERVLQSGWLAAASALAYFAIANIPTGGNAAASVVVSAAAALPLSYAAIWFGYNGPSALSRLTARIGDLSFSTYIWHMVVVNVLVQWGARDWDISGTLLVVLVAAVSMLISAASWHFVEKPALSHKRYSVAESERGERRPHERTRAAT